MFVRKTLVTLIMALAAGLIVVGCGSGGGSGSQNENKELTLAYIEWDENVAVSTLTKILMEEELGYESVELQLVDVGAAYQSVASGDVDGWQDSWLPGQQNYLDEVEDQVEVFEPWYEGQTKYGIAVLEYMEGVETIGDLSETELDSITGIEPGAAFHEQINDTVIPDYNLDMDLVESSTPAMLAEVQRASNNQEPIAFLAWSPHWMNEEYNIRYLEDPQNAQGDFDEPMDVTTIVRTDLEADDPVAYEFMQAVSLNPEEMNSMQVDIQDAGADNPEEGVNVWLEENRDVVEPWLEAAQNAEGS